MLPPPSCCRTIFVRAAVISWAVGWLPTRLLRFPTAEEVEDTREKPPAVEEVEETLESGVTEAAAAAEAATF